MNELDNNNLDKTNLKKVKKSIKRVPPQIPAVGQASFAANSSTVLKKIKRIVRKVPPQVPQQNINPIGGDKSANIYQNQRLKKVKRPVVKVRPQTPIPSDNISSSNPFQQRMDNVSTDVNAFNSSDILNVNNLPTTEVNSSTQQNNFEPKFIEDEFDNDYNNYYQMPSSSTNKKMIIVAAFAAFVVGFFVSRLFFSEQKITRSGLQGVVVNAEVPHGRARCGMAEPGQGCVLYIMNPQRQELNARDFYDLAAQLTGRQRFVIETGNMRYSNMKIRPGEIGQFNIPPLTQ